METKFISLKVIIDRIMMSPLYLGMKFDSAILWAVDVINLIEIPEHFVQKTAKVFVEDYRGMLPYDYIAINKVDIADTPSNFNGRKAMHTSSDPFIKAYPKRVGLDNREVELDYRIEGDYIYTGLQEGTLEVSYKALPLDSDNYIMIPDNTFIVKAVESYIQWQYLRILWDLDETTRDKVEYIEQQYSWAIGQAQSQRGLENLDKIESWKNAVSRLVLLKNVHETDYRYATTKEYRRI